MIRLMTQLMGTAALPDVGKELKGKLGKALRAVTRAAKPLIRSGVKERYTYKGAISIRSRTAGLSSQVKVTGARKTLRHFKVSGGKKPRKLFAMVVRGQGGVIARGFKHGSVYFQRIGRARLPIKGLYGPSVAEMAGKEPQPAKMIQQRIGELLSAQLGAMM